jgi:hypothetical protein
VSPRRAHPSAVVLALVASTGTLAAGACSVGTGRGEARGSLRLVECGVDVPEYDLAPTFFGADFVQDPDVAGAASPIVVLRVQRGSYGESSSDGLLITVNDLNALAREHLGEPLDLTPVPDGRRLVDVTFYANETCEAGYPDEFWRVAGVLPAVSGTITFDAVYAPDVDRSQTEFRASFADVRFASRERPDTRNATLSGYFEFTYQRGTPAQRFP